MIAARGRLVRRTKQRAGVDRIQITARVQCEGERSGAALSTRYERELGHGGSRGEIEKSNCSYNSKDQWLSEVLSGLGYG